jgi:hypothetical protein
MSVLTGLKLVAAKRPTKVSDVVLRRTKISKRLLEQIELAKIMQGQNGIAPTKLRIETDAVTGEERTTEVRKRVKEWFFTADNGKLVVTLRYGSKTIEFAKGKTAVELSSAEQLVSTLSMLRDAVNSGELDTQLEAASAQVKEMFKK